MALSCLRRLGGFELLETIRWGKNLSHCTRALYAPQLAQAWNDELSKWRDMIYHDMMRWGPQWWRYVDMYFDDLTYWIYLGFREDEKKDTRSPARCLLGSNLWNKRDQISGKREQKEIKWWLGVCWGGDRYPASQLSVQDLTIALLRKPAFENHPEDKKVAAEQKPTFICGIFQENAFRSQKKVLSQSHVYTGGRYISI